MKTIKTQKSLLDHNKELATAGKIGIVVMVEIFSKFPCLLQIYHETQ
jgi:hypothetical protein